jgi:CheY-like chemotaxis protein
MEAVSRIRSWEKERKTSAVPIIALTADAVSGMKEMFLENGFNDYLSKPIEIKKLDEILGKWLIRRKKVKELGAGSRQQAASSFMTIPGVDVQRGIILTGGTLEGYQKVLATFRKDALERLPFLQNGVPAEKDLPLFTMQVHALKSAAASIGAVEISAQAEALEDAGKSGDMQAISEALPVFAERLAALAEGISAVMNNEQAVMNNEQLAAITPLLTELAAALQARDFAAIGLLAAKLEDEKLDPQTAEKAAAISDAILMAEYGEALEAVKTLMAEKKES